MGVRTWPAEAVEYARRRWQRPGVRAQQIAEGLYRAYQLKKSRNAVIGLMHRMDVACGTANPASNRSYGIVARGRPRSLGAAATEQKAPPIAPIVDLSIPLPPEPKHLTVMQLRADACRWPYGEGPFTFCGHAQVPGRPYCWYHSLKAYR